MTLQLSLARSGLVFFLIGLFPSCIKKKDYVPVPIIPPTISSLSVSQGYYNTIVKVNGSGFSPKLEENAVLFNGVGSWVTEATANQLTVLVPLGAGTGMVSVISKGSSPVTGPMFTYLLSYVMTSYVGTGYEYFVNLDSVGFVAVDAAKNVFVSSGYNNSIHKITPPPLTDVSSLIANALPAFNYASGVAVDAAGNLYVADRGNHVIRKVLPGGAVSIFAGSYGLSGNQDGQGLASRFNNPTGLAMDKNGNLFVADFGNNLVRKITPDGTVSTFAGNGSPASIDGQGISASFNAPSCIAADIDGNIYVEDVSAKLGSTSNEVRKITPDGVVATLIPGGLTGSGNTGLTVDTHGNVYISDTLGHKIHKFSNGVLSTFAGKGTIGFDNAIYPDPHFAPFGLAFDSAGVMYVADKHASVINKIEYR